MIQVTYRTKTDKTVVPPNMRLPITGRIYVEVRFPIISSQLVKPQGRYYIIDANGKEYALTNFTGFSTEAEITALENTMLQDFTNQRNVFAAIKERIPQFALITIYLENMTNQSDNYGISDDDLEIVE